MENTKPKLADVLNNIQSKIDLLGTTQMMIVDKLSKDDEHFRLKFIANALAHDSVRHGFTEYLDETGAPDALKLMMMEMNEMAIKVRNQIEKEEE